MALFCQFIKLRLYVPKYFQEFAIIALIFLSLLKKNKWISYILQNLSYFPILILKKDMSGHANLCPYGTC